MIINIFEIPYKIKKRPSLYLVYSKNYKCCLLSLILTYISWYWIWIKDVDWFSPDNNWFKFLKYIRYYTIWNNCQYNYIPNVYECIMLAVDNDEEKALDLFFKLLDEFIEKEWIKIEI